MFSDEKALHEYLQHLSEPDYAAFSAPLIPNLSREIMGVRIPALRKLARKLAHEDANRALALIPQDPTHEEVLLRGFIIGYARLTWDEWKAQVTDFVPLIDNWAVCDMVCTSLTGIRKNRATGWTFLLDYLQRDAEFEQRFALIMLLEHYLTEEYTDRILDLLTKFHPKGYYSAMAVGWLLQCAFLKMPDRVFAMLQNQSIEKESRKLARKKILESLRTPAEWRKRIKNLTL